MDGAENDRFNMIRRHSLRNEVDGSFEELEDVEDSSETPPSNQYLLTHQECVLLNRVLSDKTKLPPACFAPPSSRAVRRAATRAPKPVPQDESALGGVVRRITGAVQPVLSSLNDSNPPKKELGGVVTQEQCQALADYLSPSVGGQYLIPQACLKLLDMGDDAEREKGREDVYGRLKRRPTVIAKEGFPPTVC
eukprot:g7337.t1